MIPVHGENTSKDKEAKFEKRHRLQDVLHLQNRVQEMVLLDADELKKDTEVMAVLKQVRDQLNKLVGGNRMSRREMEAAAKKMGFGA